MGQTAKVFVNDSEESLEATEEEQKPKKIQSKRGAKQISDTKLKNSARVIFDQAKPSPIPVNVYREKVNSTEGTSGDYGWWTMDGESLPHGRIEIVKINPLTEEERTVGYEYTIPYTEALKKKLVAQQGARTKFYHKDGESTITVRPEDW